jgi:hypothetical protein
MPNADSAMRIESTKSSDRFEGALTFENTVLECNCSASVSEPDGQSTVDQVLSTQVFAMSSKYDQRVFKGLCN